MQATWLEVGPVDELANAIANLILGDAELNAKWIAKWRELDRERSMKEPGDCLLGRDDITIRLGEITCPAIVFHGTADASIPIELAESLCARLRDCRGLVRVQGAPHAANLTHPDQVNGPLLEFLRSL
jgi:pimeloyl-ACP methyl ester carboxylesterase